MIEEMQPNHGLPEKPAVTKRKRATGPRRNPSKTAGRKTLIAALAAALLALADLFLTVRLGIKLF